MKATFYAGIAAGLTTLTLANRVPGAVLELGNAKYQGYYDTPWDLNIWKGSVN